MRFNQNSFFKKNCYCRNALKSVCTLIPVLGVTWIFGIFAINEDAIVFQYIFTIANSIQVRFDGRWR